MPVRDPYTAPGTFRKAQLHCHTTASDGRISPRDLLGMYKDAGYTFVAITDHNRVTRYDDLNGPAFLAVHGTEDTVTHLLPLLGPHLGRLFVDARSRRGTAQARIDATTAAGGIASLCHPTWSGNLWTARWDPKEAIGLGGYQLMEIWNPHSRSDRDVALWHTVLRARGRSAPVWAVAVDDCHRHDQFDRGWIMAKVAEISAEALKRSLKAGAFYATTGVTADFGADEDVVWASWSDPPDCGIRFIDAQGNLRTESDSREARYRVRGDERFVLVEIASRAGARAWSQPFWIV